MPQLEQHLEQLIESSGGMIYRLRLKPSRAFAYIGGAVEAITGHRAVEFYADVDLPVKAVHPDDGELVRGMLHDSRKIAERLPDTITLRWVHADGRVVVAEHRRIPIHDAAGKIVAVEGLARDVTDRVDAQRRLRRSQQQLRYLARRLQTAREEERTSIARELHDELGQNLTAIKLELDRAVALFRRDQLEPKAVDRLQSLVGLVEIGISTVKRIATDLRPPTLDYLGLADAIRWEAVAFKARTGLRCRVRAETEGRLLQPDQQVVIFRIFEEALTNVVRHAKASAVDVILSERADVFELQVRDNGRGISTADAENPHAIGLLGMRERAALIGGTFEITGRRGKGTLVRVRVKTNLDEPLRGTVRPTEATNRQAS
jgi:PAS domain S-box-containing protein